MGEKIHRNTSSLIYIKNYLLAFIILLYLLKISKNPFNNTKAGIISILPIHMLNIRKSSAISAWWEILFPWKVLHFLGLMQLQKAN
jgi:hypothetical protein